MFAKNNLKKIMFILCILTVIFTLFQVIIYFINENIRKSTEYNDQLCKHGIPAKWVNACVCDNTLLYSGKYCSEPAGRSCLTNSDCPKRHYCSRHEDKGVCYKTEIRNVYNTETIDYTLSDSLMSYYNAESFCSALGKGYRSATRADFNCTTDGISCLDREIILNLQKTFGNIGFFWLDEKADSNNAYYADINDGIVYNINKNNSIYSQAMCIRGKK